MKKFLAAVQFLTIIPVGVQTQEEDLTKSVFWFPAVGLVLGLVLAGSISLLRLLSLPLFTLSVIAAVLLIILTRAMHLDGLADTCDALLSMKSKDEMLAIMRDPHIGVMGVIGIVSVILLKTSLFYAIGFSLLPVALVLACVLSRFTAVLSMALFMYARPDGKAKVFFNGISRRDLVVSGLCAATVAVFLKGFIAGVTIFCVATAAAWLICKFISRKISGITGDSIGAVIELTETVVLFGVFILSGKGGG